MSLPSSLIIAARLNNVVVSFLGSERSAQWFVLQIVGGPKFLLREDARSVRS